MWPRIDVWAVRDLGQGMLCLVSSEETMQWDEMSSGQRWAESRGAVGAFMTKADSGKVKARRKARRGTDQRRGLLYAMSVHGLLGVTSRAASQGAKEAQS